MTATPSALTVSPLVDLRLCSCADLEWPEADLVIADPPWSYVQKIGATRADNHYKTLPTSEIVRLLDRIPGRRLALWITFPLLAEWFAAIRGWSWGRSKTGGAWAKSDGREGHYGQGYHWAGCAEPVLLYTRSKPKPYTNRKVRVRSAWFERPGKHSVKPVRWQAQWIEKWCPPGGLVSDPFAGLGSVEEAVLLAGGGRRCLATEVDPDRYAASLARIAGASAAQVDAILAGSWHEAPERRGQLALFGGGR